MVCARTIRLERGTRRPFPPSVGGDTIGHMPALSRRHALRRRFAPLLLAGLFLVPSAAPVSATTTVSAASTAESAALTYANNERTAHGLVALRLDPRVQAIAEGRAQVMAQTDQLSHDQADGNNVFDLLSAAGITWYGAGEIIAWNTTSNLAASAKQAVAQWMGSSPHRAILLSKDYDYVAFGVSVSPTSGKRYWAGVYIKGPDRTGAWTHLYAPTKHILSSTRSRVSFHWTGADTRLQVLTSGLRYFEVQRRFAGGTWVSYGHTTATSLSTSWARGHTYEFRVRAVDRAGNWGSWKTVSVTL